MLVYTERRNDFACNTCVHLNALPERNPHKAADRIDMYDTESDMYDTESEMQPDLIVKMKTEKRFNP